MSFDSIPSFSMLDLNKRDENTIRKLKLALTSHGFFTITDHGIADEVLEKSYKVQPRFFFTP
jgi:isopenicillin N synthase-like dioxygenase